MAALVLSLALSAMAIPGLAATEPVQDWPGWVRPTATTAAIYGSLYVLVVGAVQVATRLVDAVAPASWGAASQTFGIPLLMVPLMAQMVPLLRRTVPATVDHWLGEAPPDAVAPASQSR